MFAVTSQAALWFALPWLPLLLGGHCGFLPDELAPESCPGLHNRCNEQVLLQTRLTSARVHDQGPPHLGQGLQIYLVGNGPMSEEDHDIIAKALPEQVFRFNGMSNLRPTEPVGRVFLRRCGSGYWGFEYNRCQRLGEAAELIFIGNHGNKSEWERYESQCADEFGNSTVVFAPGSRTVTYQNVSVEAPAEYPSGWSSGFLGLAHVRSLMPGAAIEVLGMNWNTAAKDQAGPHPFAIEEKYFEEAHDVTVHSTPNATYHRRDTCISQ